MREEWKNVKYYENKYQVSTFGRVRNKVTRRILTHGLNRNGYHRVNLYDESGMKSKFVHRLVAQAFKPNPENKPQVNHIDEDKANNNVNNLEWMTAKENNNYGTRIERVSKIQGVPILVIDIATGETNEYHGMNECARQLKVDSGNVSKAVNGILKQYKGYIFKRL